MQTSSLLNSNDVMNEEVIVENNHLSNWMTLLLESFDVQEIVQAYQKIDEARNRVTDQNVTTMIELHLIRQYCKVSDLSAANKQIENLTPFIKNFTDEQQYYWYKFRGNVYSLESNLMKAYSMYLTAEALTHKLHFSDAEVADLYYSLGVTCSSLRKTADAIFFIEKSLEIYQKTYNSKRCSQCHITLGINYRRLKNFEEAIKQYNAAVKLAMRINDYTQINLAHMNLGHLYSVLGKSRMAIGLYEETFTSPHEINEENKLLNILSLVKEYYAINEFEAAKSWILKGFQILNVTIEKYEGIKLELLVYSHLLNEQYEQLEIVIKQNVLPYFNSKNNFMKIATYSELLSNYYAENHMYKKALEFEMVANSAYKNLIEI